MLVSAVSREFILVEEVKERLLPVCFEARLKALCKLLRLTGPPLLARLCFRPWRVGAGNSH